MSQLHGAWRALPSYARVGIIAFVSYVAANVIFGVELGTPLWAAGLCTWFILAVTRIARRERRLNGELVGNVEDDLRFLEITSNWD